MAALSQIDITARTLDMGSRIAAVAHVTSVAYRRGRPLAAAGAVLIAAALAGVGYDILLGKGLGAIKAGGSTVMWIALVGLGLGTFALVYQRREITIVLADGGRIRLPVGREDFARAVLARLGEAMRATPDAALHYHIDLKSETVQILSLPTGALPTAAEAHRPGVSPERAPAGLSPLGSLPHALPAGPAPYLNGHGHGHGNGHAPINGAGAPLLPSDAGQPWTSPPGGGDANRPGLAAGPPTFGPLATPSMSGGLNAHPFGPTTGPHRQPSAQPPNPKRELDALVALVVRSSIQHKSALLELLEVVDDHLKGGGTDRADAAAHWQSFASYVEQYLADVDGLSPMTKRFGRHFA